MSVSIGKIAGVESVHVFLNKGLVDIKLKPGNTVRMGQIKKAIEDDAFTPKDARVVVIGELISQNGKLQFKVAGTNEIFPVASTLHKAWQKEAGRTLTVNGLISAPGKRSEPETLRIVSVSGQSTTRK